MSKILFINPPNEFISPVLPLGLASIAAYLKSKDKNLDIQILDAWVERISLKELEDRISQSKADIIGIYVASPCYDNSKLSIEACRRALPDAIIVAGGPHPSAAPAETLKDIPQLDICCIGEGEITMYELVHAIKNNSSFSNVDGLAFRSGIGGKIIFTKPREFIKDLDSLPFPARELFPLEKYKVQPPFGKKNPFFMMITSRGCPYQCAFCSKDVFKSSYRARTPKNVCDEIEYLITKYGAQEIQLYDDDFTMDMKRAEAICDEILKRNIKIRWFSGTRVDLVNEKLLRKMKKAGCWLIGYGVESGNQKILDSINKGIRVEQIISAFKMTRKVGILTSCSFIYGLPGETKEILKETFDLAKKIKPNFLTISPLRVYPGSRIFKLIQGGNYLGKLRTLKKSENLVSAFFSRGNYTIFEDNLTFEETKKIIQKSFRKFYFRPQYILQSLTSIQSFSDFKYYLRGGFEVIKMTFKQ